MLARPFPLKPALTASLLACLVLASCGRGGDGDSLGDRPRSKPDQLTARVKTPNPAAGEAPLTLARVSTKSGEILILEPDGSVTTMQLDSPAGRDAFQVSEAQIAALEGKVDPAVFAKGFPMGPTAQDKALEAFAAKTQPALPEMPDGVEIDPEDFLGTRVVALNPKGAGDLVEVTANLREGVDAEIAFSYATCALAGWAQAQGAPYGRHVRTLQQSGEGKLRIGAAFTLSQGKPLGLRVMETDETLRECKARGIPVA